MNIFFHTAFEIKTQINPIEKHGNQYESFSKMSF